MSAPSLHTINKINNNQLMSDVVNNNMMYKIYVEHNNDEHKKYKQKAKV